MNATPTVDPPAEPQAKPGALVPGLRWRAKSRRHQQAMARRLRDSGLTWPQIAARFRDMYRVNALVAMRMAHSWTQGEVTHRWTDQWPDDPKTFKNLSLWETGGHNPSLTVLSRLAHIYSCAVADLVDGIGDYRHRDPRHHPTNPLHPPDTLQQAQQLHHALTTLGATATDQITSAALTWAARQPPHLRQQHLDQITTALTLAGQHCPPTNQPPPPAATPAGSLRDITGIWTTNHPRTGYRIQLRRHRHRIIGTSLPHPTHRIRLDLDLAPHHRRHHYVGTYTETGAGHTSHGLATLTLSRAGTRLHGHWTTHQPTKGPDIGAWTLHRQPDPLETI